MGTKCKKNTPCCSRSELSHCGFGILWKKITWRLNKMKTKEHSKQSEGRHIPNRAPTIYKMAQWCSGKSEPMFLVRRAFMQRRGKQEWEDRTSCSDTAKLLSKVTVHFTSLWESSLPPVLTIRGIVKQTSFLANQLGMKWYLLANKDFALVLWICGFL